MTLDLALLIGATVALVAVFAARLGSRLGLPALLIFLALGMAMGESGLGLRFNNAAQAQALGFAALIVILAEGGLTTRWSSVRPVIGVAGLLATLGAAVSVAVMAVFDHVVLRMSWSVAVLFGAVTAPTDSAAVFSVLRGVPVPGRLRSILEAESGLNDAPTVLLVTAATSLALGEHPAGGVLGVIGLVAAEIIGGTLLGVAVGLLGRFIMRRIALPASGLYPLAAIAWTVLAYGLGVAGHVSGFAAVYVSAVVLGNGKLPHRHATLSFAEGIGWVAQIGLFVMLGLLATPGRIGWQSVLSGVGAGLCLTFIARPLAVVACAGWFRLAWAEQAFLSWAGLRGAVPIILATVPMSRRLPHAATLFDDVLVFVVVFTCLQGPTLPWLAGKLGLTDPQALRDVDIEVAPLDKVDADLLQVRVPEGSRLAGVSVTELRLPPNAVVSLIIRGREQFSPSGRDRLREGDELLLVAPRVFRSGIERRLAEIGRGGRLARWYGVDLSGDERPGKPRSTRAGRMWRRRTTADPAAGDQNGRGTRG